jgi:NADH-quinone oxidoreductase subunit L
LAAAFTTDAAGWLPIYGEILWGVLSVAALGTAFYMFRLYFLVFHGTSRADAETQSHIHESPPTMTVPLLVLAAFTVVAGFVGLPHLSFLHDVAPNLLGAWLQPSLIDLSRESLAGSVVAGHPNDVALLVLMGVALAVGVVGIATAARLYSKGPSGEVGRFTAGAGAELYRVVKNKFYVDEIYDRLIVRPFRGVSVAVFEVIDRFLIDWVLVEGSAFIMDVLGRIARWFQNGQVQRYLVALVLGGAVILLVASRPRPAFDWQQVDYLTVEFTADVGAGPGSDGAEVAFDFDGDGEPESSATWRRGDPPPVTTWSFSRPGKHRVSMWLTDAVFEKKGVVTRTIEVEGFPPAEAPPPEAGGEDQERQPLRTGGER